MAFDDRFEMLQRARENHNRNRSNNQDNGIDQRLHKDRIFKHTNVVVQAHKLKFSHGVVKETCNESHNHRSQDKDDKEE